MFREQAERHSGSGGKQARDKAMSLVYEAA